jgi:hypothetical protein
MGVDDAWVEATKQAQKLKERTEVSKRAKFSTKGRNL